eukprot:1965412-Amphidinium_carterae.1
MKGGAKGSVKVSQARQQCSNSGYACRHHHHHHHRRSTEFRPTVPAARASFWKCTLLYMLCWHNMRTQEEPSVVMDTKVASKCPDPYSKTMLLYRSQ